MMQERSSAKLRLSSVHTTTVKVLSLEANSLTIHYLEDLVVVVPNIRGARVASLDVDALGFVLRIISSCIITTIFRAISGEVDSESASRPNDLFW
jgi:hypothetical protein